MNADNLSKCQELTGIVEKLGGIVESTFHYVSEADTHSGKYFPLCLLDFPLCLWVSKTHKVDSSIVYGIHGLWNGMQ